MTIFSIFTMPMPLLADYCVPIHRECTEGAATRNIEGYEVHRDCWAYAVQYRCFNGNYTDYCQTIHDTIGCEQISNTCTETGKDGLCDKYLLSYRCGNLLKAAKGETLLDSEYTIVKDELDRTECTPHEIKENCAEIGEACSEGAETRIINGLPVAKDCWKYAKKYSCKTGSYLSDCDELAATCKLSQELCLEYGKDGSCNHSEKHYVCDEFAGKAPKTTRCRTRYCIDGDCEDGSYEPNENMGKAISYLSVLKNLKGDIDQSSCSQENPKACTIFKGEAQSCRKAVTSARNCCSDKKGWAENAKLLGCKEDERLLSKRKEAGLCHHVGTYCKTKSPKPFSTCLEKKQSYCCFQSKIARIIQQQGKAQLGLSWGSVEQPDCSPMTIEQLQRLDFSKINLQEIYQDAAKNLNQEKMGQTQEQLKQKVETKYQNNMGQTKTRQELIGDRLKKHYEAQ